MNYSGTASLSSHWRSVSAGKEPKWYHAQQMLLSLVLIAESLWTPWHVPSGWSTRGTITVMSSSEGPVTDHKQANLNLIIMMPRSHCRSSNLTVRWTLVVEWEETEKRFHSWFDSESEISHSVVCSHYVTISIQSMLNNKWHRYL